MDILKSPTFDRFLTIDLYCSAILVAAYSYIISGLNMVNGSSLGEEHMNSPRLEFKWYSRMGPVLLVAFKDKKICIAVFCHRRRGRNFEIFGYVVPLCARCTGISVGAIMIYLLSFCI